MPLSPIPDDTYGADLGDPHALSFLPHSHTRFGLGLTVVVVGLAFEVASSHILIP